jgi:hypothetical protein
VFLCQAVVSNSNRAAIIYQLGGLLSGVDRVLELPEGGGMRQRRPAMEKASLW